MRERAHTRKDREEKFGMNERIKKRPKQQRKKIWVILCVRACVFSFQSTRGEKEKNIVYN